MLTAYELEKNKNVYYDSKDKKLTTHFRLSEFTLKNGGYCVHKNLVYLLQEIREKIQKPISIVPQSVHSNGLSVSFTTRAKKSDYEWDLFLMKKQGFIQFLKFKDNFCEITASENPIAVKMQPKEAIDRIVKVSSGYETIGDPFSQVTGNFDGAGLSFGPLQVNFKMGSLPIVLERFHNLNSDLFLDCFGEEQYLILMQILKLKTFQQIDWANSISVGPNKSAVQKKWRLSFEKLGQQKIFQEDMVNFAMTIYGEKLLKTIRYLKAITNIEINNLSCLCALYDLCVQQGSIDRAISSIRKKLSGKSIKDQFHITEIVGVERGLKSNTPWQSDCISRRLGLINRSKVKVCIDGYCKNRDNRFFYLLRDVNVINFEDAFQKVNLSIL